MLPMPLPQPAFAPFRPTPGHRHRFLYSNWMLAFVGAFVFIGATVWASLVARNAILQQDAEVKALEWGEHFMARFDDLERVLFGELSHLRTLRSPREPELTGGIFQYKIFDIDGNLRLSSDKAVWQQMHVYSGGASPVAAAVARTGRQVVSTRFGDGISRPQLYATAYFPLVKSYGIIGAGEVYIDHTERAKLLDGILIKAGTALMALTTIAFLVPLLFAAWEARGRRDTMRQLRHIAAHDELTGLRNRTAFLESTENLIARGSAFSLHLVDLDRFKDVNDTYGHPLGDELLRQVAGRLTDIAGPDMILARLGGDEFAVLQPADRTGSAGSGQLARRIVASLCMPFALGPVEVSIGASIGTSLCPRDGTSRERLLMAADLALYAAKRAGRGRSVEFVPEIEQEYRDRIALETRLRQAVENEDFELFYQPLYATDGVRLRAFEALLRMRACDGSIIAPAVFIPIAEELRLIDRVGRWVMREACRTATLWPDELCVAVNLSPLQFLGGGLAETVRAVLAETGLDPRRLELEMTESVLLEKPEEILLQLHSIKAMGVSIALDDFGTGYSSLSYLWRFPFDTLKVDGSFMAGLSDPHSRSREVLDTIIALGRVLNLHITAEGVETREQIEILQTLRCDFVQGYLLGRPVASTEVAAVILNAMRPHWGGQPAIERLSA
ncbi:MAG: EAL domain-containing protein [Rhizobiales bacterium]|nr:EAL domain-containing protein [Hyphomicrobiales bacterium]